MTSKDFKGDFTTMSDKNTIRIDRLKKCIDGEKNRQEIADKIGCDVSLITKHYNGDRNVTIDYLKKYAKCFKVSSDYLLGLSDAPTSDKDLQFICDYTGLSINTINNLRELKSNNQYANGDNVPIDIIQAITNQLKINQEICRDIKAEIRLAHLFLDKAKNDINRDISDRKDLVNDATDIYNSVMGEIYIIQNSVSKAINNYLNIEDVQMQYNIFLEQKRVIIDKIEGEENEEKKS